MMRYSAWLTLVLLACTETVPSPKPENVPPASKSDSATATDTAAPVITLTLNEPNLIFRYFHEGQIVVATSLDKIPEDKRHAVYIDNLDVSPADRQSQKFLQRYDLSEKPGSGEYVGTPILRQHVEAQIERLRPKPKPKPKETSLDKTQATNAKVTLYSTKSCGYCRKARQFLTKRNVPFTEKDIEESGAARKELQSKARKAGVQVQGVPVLDVNGQIIPGFNPQAILRALDS